MNKSLEMLTSLIGEEVRRAVFAAFAPLRSVKNLEPHSYDKAVEDLRKNDVFIAAKNAGVDMNELKKIIIGQYQKHTDQLMKNFSQAYDYACDQGFLIIKEKDKK